MAQGPDAKPLANNNISVLCFLLLRKEVIGNDEQSLQAIRVLKAATEGSKMLTHAAIEQDHGTLLQATSNDLARTNRAIERAIATISGPSKIAAPEQQGTSNAL